MDSGTGGEISGPGGRQLRRDLAGPAGRSRSTCSWSIGAWSMTPSSASCAASGRGRRSSSSATDRRPGRGGLPAGRLRRLRQHLCLQRQAADGGRAGAVRPGLGGQIADAASRRERGYGRVAEEVPAAGNSVTKDLSPREKEIAQLVAEGLPNIHRRQTRDHRAHGQGPSRRHLLQDRGGNRLALALRVNRRG